MSNVILVDENDKIIGTAEKNEAHVKGLLHRAFSVFVFRTTHDGFELLIHQRASTKYHCGGLWTNTCCSHPKPGSELLFEAVNRLEDEMGFRCELEFVDKFLYRAELTNSLIEHEVDHVFVGTLSRDNSPVIKPNPEEVSNYEWISLTKLESLLAGKQELFTPWFLEAYGIAKRKIPSLCST